MHSLTGCPALRLARRFRRSLTNAVHHCWIATAPVPALARLSTFRDCRPGPHLPGEQLGQLPGQRWRPVRAGALLPPVRGVDSHVLRVEAAAPRYPSPSAAMVFPLRAWHLTLEHPNHPRWLLLPPPPCRSGSTLRPTPPAAAAGPTRTATATSCRAWSTPWRPTASTVSARSFAGGRGSWLAGQRTWPSACPALPTTSITRAAEH